ncbi:MAG: hypothetical protein WBI92_11765 [Cloacibacterium sp.]|uniref:hypothetical protein n=1 Tax=Cloacibacterium sp. TaxID=1913682 RepID=UPI003C7133A9
MFKDFRKTFGRQAIQDVAQEELYEAEKALLAAQTKLEYAQANVDAHAARVARLKKFTANSVEVQNDAQ